VSHLHELIAARVAEWRDGGYPHDAYPAISEILEFQTDLDAGAPRFLRAPQLQALETYWYLRLVEGTPHVLDLYRRLYPATTEFLEALGLGQPQLQRMALDEGVDALLDRVKIDDELVRDYKLESVRETLTLDYSSYILALAMGAGKTILIGAIIATEFTMAQEYPDGDFVQNALVFAPGKTIIEALRELADIPWDRVVPPRMYGAFAASVSLTFTRDGDPDIPVIRGSLYNIVVTNTEKIRIQKEAVTRGIVGSLFSTAKEDEVKREVANRRLQAIASLPHLGIFSGERYTWSTVHLPLPKTTIERWYRHVEEETGRRFNKADVTGPGGAAKGSPVYDWKGQTRAWRFSKRRMQELDDKGLLVYSSSGMPYLKRYLDESKGVPLQDWWDDISMVRGIHRAGAQTYPTEKPEPLLERVLEISSEAGDIVLDCFIGSGTTAAVAQKLGRRWIGCDNNKGAIQTTSKRLQSVIRAQADEQPAPQQELEVGDVAIEADATPAQLGFTVWRVNDYDLQIQHNEAVELACDHIGIERSRTDGFFDGTLGKRLVKIVPFGHPLSPVDLEEVKRELEARPEEDRDIVMVCLGKELAADAWLEEWNQLRRVRGGAPNRIEAIELRSDPKYGKFIAHRPAEARVEIRREKKKIVVEVQDFISPSIVERLDVDVPLFRAKIPDWRSMVDCVMIDAAHDGTVFNVALSDVPEKRDDLVAGCYELPAPKGKITVAVKIIDMLGEEVVVTARV
jgi:hypothetical protein